MLHTTFALLRKHDACRPGYAQLVKSLGPPLRKYSADTPIPLTAVLDSNGLLDALWCLRATIEPSDGFARDFACDCADPARHIMDKHDVAAIEVARRYARGSATTEELAAARNPVTGEDELFPRLIAHRITDEPNRYVAHVASGAAVLSALPYRTQIDVFSARFRRRLLAHDPTTNPLGEIADDAEAA